MASDKVPVTIRDFFWEDPFFSNFWDEFDGIRSNIWKEHKDSFSKFEKQFKSLSFESSKKSTSSQKSSLSQESQNSSRDLMESFPVSQGFPVNRRWLMPKDFFSKSDDFDFDLDDFKIMPTMKRDEVLKVSENDKKFEVIIDTDGFKPDEIQVKITNDIVTVEAKHEEKSEKPNEKKFAARQFSRSYTLPNTCKGDQVTSNLSADGLLIITAPKMDRALKDETRKVPILKK